jgi:hypothetical protein
MPFMIDYVCILFVGDGVKRRLRRIIQQHVGPGKNTGEKREVRCMIAYITSDGASR